MNPLQVIKSLINVNAPVTGRVVISNGSVVSVATKDGTRDYDSSGLEFGVASGDLVRIQGGVIIGKLKKDENIRTYRV